MATIDPTRLAPLEYAPRLARLRAAMRDATPGLDGLLVHRLPNVRYLTGFTGSAGMLVVRPDDAVLITDGRYTEQSRQQLESAGVDARIEIRSLASDQLDVVSDVLGGVHAVGLEEHGITWAQQRTYAERLGAERLVPSGPIVEELRRTKDAGEVARIRAACAIADEAFAALLPRLAEGPTEREFALALEVAMRERGASGNSFDPIVASGPNAAMPHARPSGRRIERGELVIFDFGCIVDGYCSDMTRTLSLGDPGADARRMYDVVLAAQQAGRDAVRAGADCGVIDAACRDRIAEAGWAEAFSHGTGHGVGIEIHEAPRVAKSARDTVLRVGDVVTVEPGVYLPGIGGVRIEDTVVVEADGADALTLTPKDLVV